MGKYPRTEEQIMKKNRKKMMGNVKKRKSQMLKMGHSHRDYKEREIDSKRDVYEGYTPESIKTGERKTVEDKEYEECKREIDYATRLNKVEDFTGLDVEGDEDAKRKVLDNKLEKILSSSSDEISKIRSKGSLSGFYVAGKDETYEKFWKNVGYEDIKDSSIEAQLEGKDKITTPTYDPNTNKIIIPEEKDEYLPNKVGHELGHAMINSWGVKTKNNFQEKSIGWRIAEQYEEVSADILMKEKFGDEKAGEAVKNQLTNQIGGAKKIVREEIGEDNYEPAYEKISAHRARAEIFGLNDLKKDIDNQLFKQYQIDMNSKEDKRAETINSLTNTFTSLQGLDKEKYSENLRESIKIRMRAHKSNPG